MVALTVNCKYNEYKPDPSLSQLPNKRKERPGTLRDKTMDDELMYNPN